MFFKDNPVDGSSASDYSATQKAFAFLGGSFLVAMLLSEFVFLAKTSPSTKKLEAGMGFPPDQHGVEQYESGGSYQTSMAHHQQNPDEHYPDSQ